MWDISLHNFLNTTLPFEVVSVFKMAIAVTLGMCIGKERKHRDKAGGGRTFSFIVLGGCLLGIITLALYSQGYTFDFIRPLCYGMVSLSFATNGVIRLIRGHTEGLTTATTLWIGSILGFLVGMGYFILSSCASLLIFLILESKSDYHQ